MNNEEKLDTCDACGFQSKHEGWFYITFGGSIHCMRCHCEGLAPIGYGYYEPKEFTEEYKRWEENLKHE